jgi:hypothetical protein
MLVGENCSLKCPTVAVGHIKMYGSYVYRKNGHFSLAIFIYTELLATKQSVQKWAGVMENFRHLLVSRDREMHREV